MGPKSENGQTQALGHVTVSLRVIGHLGSDPMLTSALVSHSQFIAISRLLRESLKVEDLQENQRSTLASALDRISRRDPFAYVESVVQTRLGFSNMLRQRTPRDEDHEALLAQSGRLIESFNGDQLLMVACVYDVFFRATKASNTGQPPAMESDFVPASMTDVISSDAAASLRGRASQIGPSLAMDDWNVFVESPITVVAVPSVVDRMRRARADVRDLAAVLRPANEATDKTPAD
jgi:hypothetical protein